MSSPWGCGPLSPEEPAAQCSPQCLWEEQPQTWSPTPQHWGDSCPGPIRSPGGKSGQDLRVPKRTSSGSGSAFSLELSDQIQRALKLEEERKRAQEEAGRLEADRLAALRAKEELERQAADQIKSQEQLVGATGLVLSYREAAPGDWQSDTCLMIICTLRWQGCKVI